GREQLRLVIDCPDGQLAVLSGLGLIVGICCPFDRDSFTAKRPPLQPGSLRLKYLFEFGQFPICHDRGDEAGGGMRSFFFHLGTTGKISLDAGQARGTDDRPNSAAILDARAVVSPSIARSRVTND